MKHELVNVDTFTMMEPVLPVLTAWLVRNVGVAVTMSPAKPADHGLDDSWLPVMDDEHFPCWMKHCRLRTWHLGSHIGSLNVLMV